MQPKERQPSADIFSIIDGLILIVFFNRENFNQAALNIQTCAGLLHNSMIHKFTPWD